VSVPAARRAFLVNVAELLRRPGTTRDVVFSAPVERLAVVDARIPEGTEVGVDLHLEALPDALTVTGTVAAPWEGTCRRCLEPAHGHVVAAVTELYSPHPDSDEIWPLSGDQLDLYPLVCEALMLELPLAPLCRDDCAGLCPECGTNRNLADCGHGERAPDRRWAALEGLEFPGEGRGR